MQNDAKQCKNDLFEDIEFQEIEEKAPEFGEFQQQNAFPARVIEWEIPHLGETVKKEAKKFRIWPAAVWTGRAIGYVLIVSISFAGQLVWFLVLVFINVLSGMAMAIESLLEPGHRTRSYRQEDMAWRDRDIYDNDWGAGHYVQPQKKPDRQRQGHTNNINVNINIENH